MLPAIILFKQTWEETVAFVRLILIGTVVSFLSIGATSANDRLLAAELLKTSLECPIAIHKTKNGSMVDMLTTKNSFLGDERDFVLHESYNGAELSDGENYTRAGVNKVSVAFSKVKDAKVSGSKVTIACRGGSKCLTVRYEMSDPGHDPEWEDFTTKKSSYRMTTCGESSAKDVADTINFLAQ